MEIGIDVPADLMEYMFPHTGEATVESMGDFFLEALDFALAIRGKAPLDPDLCDVRAGCVSRNIAGKQVLMPHLALVFEKGAIEAVKELNGEEGGIIRRMVEYKEFCAPKPVWRNSIAHFAAFAFTA